MITDLDIELAQAAVEAAAADVAAAENLPPSLEAGHTYGAAKDRHGHAQLTLARLLRDAEAEREALAAREKLEKGLAKECAQRADELEASRARVTAALDAAQQVLIDLTGAVAEHNGLVDQHAAEMAAQGLTVIGDDHPGGNPSTGLVRLRGAWWSRVDAGVLVARLVHRVALTHLGYQHGLTGRLRHFGTGSARAKAAEQLLAAARLAGVETPPDAHHPDAAARQTPAS